MSKPKIILFTLALIFSGLTSVLFNQQTTKAEDNQLCQLEVSIPPHTTEVREVLIGSNDYNFARFSFFVNCDRDLVLRSLTISSFGSATFSSLRDLKIENQINGAQFSASSTNPFSAVFVPSVILRKGSTVEIDVLADVINTAPIGKSIAMQIGNNSAVDAFDSVNGMPVNVTFTAPLLYDYVGIVRSELQITQNPNTPPNQQVERGASNIPFVTFDFLPKNSSTVLNTITLTKTGTSSSDVINNVSLWVQGQTNSFMIGSAQNINPNNQIVFSNLNHQISRGNTISIAVRGNVNSSAVPGQTFRIGIQNSANITATDDINSGVDAIYTLPLYGNTMTIAGENYSSHVIASTLYNPLRATLTWDVYKGPQIFDGYSVYIQPANSTAPMNFGNSNEINKTSINLCDQNTCSFTFSGYILNDHDYNFIMGEQYKTKVFLYNSDQSAQFPYSESDRNSATYFAFSATYPDLRVEKIEHTSLNNYGPKEIIQASICNRGTAAMNNVNLVTEFRTTTGVNTHQWNGLSMDVSSCTKAFVYDSSLKITQDGYYSINATVDSDNKVVESNENNNSLIQNIYVDINNSYPKPDLIVERIDYIPLSIGVRPAEIIEATVCNRGTASMNNSNMELEFKTASGNKNGTGWSGLSLGVNSCISGYVSVAEINITKDGYYSITATADSLFEISELFENNNSFSQNIYIDIKGGTNYLPDLVVDAVDFYPDLNGRKNVIYSSICNESQNPAVFSSNFSIKASYDTGMSSFTHDLPNQSFPANSCVEDIVSAKDIGINKTGYYTVLVTADSGKILSESNENNNTRKTNQFYVTVAESPEQLPPPANYEDPVLTSFTQYKNPFIDTLLGTMEGDSAAELYRRDVLTGFANNKFRGYKKVDRAEIVKFMIKTRYDGIPEAENNFRFWDLQTGAWYIKYIIKAVNLGIISGYSDGSFRPGKKINTAEFLKIMTLTFGLETNLPYSYTDVPNSAWYAKYAGIGQKYNLFPTRGNTMSPRKKLTRRDAVMAIYNYLKNR